MTDPNEITIAPAESQRAAIDASLAPSQAASPPSASSAEKRFLTPAAIRAADDFKIEELFVPDWNGYVHVRSLRSSEIDRLQETFTKMRGRKMEQNLANFRARIALACVCQSDGADLFRVEDLDWLTRKAARPMTQIYNKAIELNGMSEEDVEELAKNCAGVPSADSPIG